MLGKLDEQNTRSIIWVTLEQPNYIFYLALLVKHHKCFYFECLKNNCVNYDTTPNPSSTSPSPLKPDPRQCLSPTSPIQVVLAPRHAPTHAPTYAWPSFPVDPGLNQTPPDTAPSGLHVHAPRHLKYFARNCVTNSCYQQC